MATYNISLKKINIMHNLSLFQQLAEKNKISGEFAVFEPTEFAASEGYKSFILPLSEGLQKWEEHKRDGRDELFHFFTGTAGAQKTEPGL